MNKFARAAWKDTSGDRDCFAVVPWTYSAKPDHGAKTEQQ